MVWLSGAESVSLPRPEKLWRNSDSSGITRSESDGPARKILPTFSTHDTNIRVSGDYIVRDFQPGPLIRWNFFRSNHNISIRLSGLGVLASLTPDTVVKRTPDNRDQVYAGKATSKLLLTHGAACHLLIPLSSGLVGRITKAANQDI